MNFNIINEDYQFKNGEVIAIFTVEGIDKRIIMYSLEDNNLNESKILISYLEKDTEGNDTITPIEDIEMRKKIINSVKEIIKGGVV